MFDKAYICIIAEPQLDHSCNRFKFNSGYSRPIFGGPNNYKIKKGNHKVIIESGNGESWVVEANVDYNQMLTIKLNLVGGNISGVNYKVASAPAGMGLVCAMSLD